ncbi:TPA: response regulator [Pseudomonas aeruginosa]|nr:response regulator [Pseudomonas aeruginosa]
MLSIIPDVLEGQRILVVDDVESERRLLAEYLQQRGCRVYLAVNGQDAFKKIQLVNPSLVLMDVLMPVWDGLTCCRMLQANPQTRHIPVVFLTGASMPEQRVQGLLSGAVDYISKPFSLEEVRLRLTIHLRGGGPARQAAPALPSQAGNLDRILFQSARQLLVRSLSHTPSCRNWRRRWGPTASA